MATSVSEFEPGKHDEEVLALRSEVWGKDHPHTDMAFYSWLFADHGDGAPSGVLVRRDRQLVCFAGLVPRMLRCQGETLRVAHGLDFMASPNMQGLSGLYAFKLVKSWLQHATRKGYDLAVCFPNEQSIRLLTSDKLKWSVIASPRLLVLPLPSMRFEEAPAKFIPNSLATWGGRLLASTLSLGQPQPGPKDAIVPLDLFDDATSVNGLWQRAARQQCLFSRQLDALQWRYGRHSIYKYRILSRRQGAAITGFVVTVRRKVFGLQSDLVVDGLWGDGDTETSRALLAAVIARARDEGTGIIGAIALAGTQFYTALRLAGLLPVPAKFDPKPFHLTGHPLTPAGAKCMNADFWHISWGDIDVV